MSDKISVLTKDGWVNPEIDDVELCELTCCECGAPSVELYKIAEGKFWALCAGDLEEVKAENCAAAQQEEQEGDWRDE